MRKHHWRYGILLLMTVWLLCSCATVKMISSFITGKDEPPKTTISNLSIVTELDANLTTATMVDLVFIYVDSVGKILPTQSLDWFKKRDMIVMNNVGNIEVVSLQLPPAYAIHNVELPERYSDAVKVMAYMNYISKGGQIGVDMTQFTDGELILKNKTIAFSKEVTYTGEQK